MDLKTEDLLLSVAKFEIASFATHVHVLARSASWRDKPSTQAQQLYLSRTIGISPTAEDFLGEVFGDVASGWVGRDWDTAVPVNTLTRGEACDALTKMVCGRMALRLRQEWKEKWEKLAEGDQWGVEHSRELDKALREYYF